MPTPRTIDIEITSRCNLRCKYCNHFTSPGDVQNELSTQEWLLFLEELKRNLVTEVSLQGGEPFCRKDIKELINGIVANKMRFSILTNGGLLTDDLAAFLKSTNRCSRLQLSIDGFNAEMHDSCRNEGSFVKAVNAIETLKRHGLKVSVRVTIHKKNVHHLSNICSFLLEELELPSFSINSVSYMGSCRTSADELQLDYEERSLAMEALFQLNNKFKGRIKATSGPLAEVKKWLDMEKARKEKREPFPHGGNLTACGCIWYQLGVRADGVMVPCILLGHIELGRINKDSLQNIWLNHPELIRLRNRKHIPLSQFEFCRGCDYIPYCTGNCPATAYNIIGKDEHPSPSSCLRRYLAAGGKLPDENMVLQTDQIDKGA